MITGNSEEEVHNKLSEIAFQKLESIIDNKGFSIETLRDLTVEELQEKLNFIDSVLGDLEKLKSIGRVDFKRGVDFDFPVNIEPYTIGYGFNPHRNFLNRKKAILEIIKTKNRIEKINSLEDLINNVSDNELKKKIEIELSALSRQTSEIEEKERQLTKEEKEFESSKKQLEISKSKLELLEKKSQIWLSILAKESVASIVGAILLIILASCLITAMFIGIETTKIIESAFLLILGYFFGHSVSKK